MLLRKSAHNLLAEHPSLIELHLHFTSRNHNFNKHNSERHCCFLSQILSSSYKIPHSKNEPHSPIQTKPTSLSPILFKLPKNHRPKKNHQGPISRVLTSVNPNGSDGFSWLNLTWLVRRGSEWLCLKLAVLVKKETGFDLEDASVKVDEFVGRVKEEISKAGDELEQFRTKFVPKFVAVLKEHFSSYGDLYTVELEDMDVSESEASKICSACITFTTRRSAERAFVNGKCWQDHNLKFMWLTSSNSRSDSGGSENSPSTHKGHSEPDIQPAETYSEPDVQPAETYSEPDVQPAETLPSTVSEEVTASENGDPGSLEIKSGVERMELGEDSQPGASPKSGEEE